jgi:hypothetical protein
MIELFTSPDVRVWEIIDFKLLAPGDRKKRVEIASVEADGRAVHRVFEETRIYWFGRIAYRDTSPRTLGNQFENARPTTTSVATQFWDRPGA